MSKRTLSLSPKGQVRLYQLRRTIHDPAFKGTPTERFFECGFTAESLERLRAQYQCDNDTALLELVKTFDLSALFIFVNNTRQQIIAAETSHFDLRPSAFVWDVLSGTESFVKGVRATHCGKRGNKDAPDNIAKTPHDVDLIFVSGLLLKDVHSKDGLEYKLSSNKDEYVKQQLIDRLTNAFRHVADQCPDGEKRAVVVPGLGAGAFAGNPNTLEGREVIERVKAQLDAAIQHVLKNLPQEQAQKIAAVVFDSYQGHEGDAQVINGIHYKASSTGAKLAAIPDSANEIIAEAGGDPQTFEGQVVKVSKIVAWDMLSCEGNEGRPDESGSYAGATYNTDDPLVVRATNVLEHIGNVNESFSAGNPYVERPTKPSAEEIAKYPISKEDEARHRSWIAYQKASQAKREAMEPIQETLHQEEDSAAKLFEKSQQEWVQAKNTLTILKGAERVAYLKTVIPCVLAPLVAATAVLTGVGFGANIAVQFFPALSTGLAGVVSGVLLGCALALVAGAIAGCVLRGKYGKRKATAESQVHSKEQEKNRLFTAQNKPMEAYSQAKVGPDEAFHNAHNTFFNAVVAISEGTPPASSSGHGAGGGAKAPGNTGSSAGGDGGEPPRVSLDL